MPCEPMGTPSSSVMRLSTQWSADHVARIDHQCWRKPRSNSGLGSTDQGTAKGISSGGWIPARARSMSATSSSSVGIRRISRSVRRRSPKSGQASASEVAACMGTRRYTPPMGAVETMQDFFEKLNGGDREGAVSLMDEKTEMRVHVGEDRKSVV